MDELSEVFADHLHIPHDDPVWKPHNAVVGRIRSTASGSDFSSRF